MAGGLRIDFMERSAGRMKDDPVVAGIGQLVLVTLASAICLVINLVTDEDLAETLEDLF